MNNTQFLTHMMVTREPFKFKRTREESLFSFATDHEDLDLKDLGSVLHLIFHRQYSYPGLVMTQINGKEVTRVIRVLGDLRKRRNTT